MTHTVRAPRRFIEYLERTGVWDNPPSFTAGEVVKSLREATPDRTGGRVVAVDYIDRAAMRRMAHRMWEDALADTSGPPPFTKNGADVRCARTVLRQLGFTQEGHAPGPVRGQ